MTHTVFAKLLITPPWAEPELVLVHLPAKRRRACLNYGIVSGSVGKRQKGSLGTNLDITEIPGTLDAYSKANPAMGASGEWTMDPSRLPVWGGWPCSESSLPSPGLANCNDSAVK